MTDSSTRRRAGAEAPLILAYLVKIAFAYRLTRGLFNVQEEREQLLVTARAAADRERTLIASDLRDGVVQGLAGAGYTLTDAARSTRAAGQPEVANTLADTARSLRQWVRELRSLIVTVTPPALHSEGLRATLTDLVATLEARGIDVELDVRVGDALGKTGESLIYRVAQEAIRNVVRHARASRVELIVAGEDGWLQVRLTCDGGDHPVIRVLIVDDHPLVRQGLNGMFAGSADIDAAAGHAPISPLAALALLPQRGAARRPLGESLSPREREVLAMVAVGLRTRALLDVCRSPRKLS